MLRAIAVLAVVYYHGIYLSAKDADPIYNFLAVVVPQTIPVDGVTWFFVLSGFLIGRILLRTVTRDDFDGAALRQFWIRRWFRTLPNYLLVLTVLIVVFRLMERATPEAPSFFFFIQNFNNWHPDFFHEAWSLAVEEWFYLLIPIPIFLSVKFGRLSRGRAILTCIAVVIVAEAAFRAYRVLNHPEMTALQWDHELRKQVSTRLDSLMFGVLGAYISLFHKEAWKRFAIVSLVAGVALIHYNYNVDHTPFFRDFIILTSSPLAVLLLLPFLSSWQAKGYFASIVTFISLISYSMYLLHLTLVQGVLLPNVVTSVSQVCWRCGQEPWFAYGAYWSLTIGGSWLLYKYFEKPTTALREKWAPRKRTQLVMAEVVREPATQSRTIEQSSGRTQPA